MYRDTKIGGYIRDRIAPVRMIHVMYTTYYSIPEENIQFFTLPLNSRLACLL